MSRLVCQKKKKERTSYNCVCVLWLQISGSKTNGKHSIFSSFYLFNHEKRAEGFKALESSISNSYAPAFQHNTGTPQPFCPLCALLCLCNFPPHVGFHVCHRYLLWPSRCSQGQPLGKTAVDPSCEHTWETCEALSGPWTPPHTFWLCRGRRLSFAHHSSRCLKRQWRGRIWLSDIMECDGWMWNPLRKLNPLNLVGRGITIPYINQWMPSIIINLEKRNQKNVCMFLNLQHTMNPIYNTIGKKFILMWLSLGPAGPLSLDWWPEGGSGGFTWQDKALTSFPTIAWAVWWATHQPHKDI